MNCPNCGRENSPDARLCDQCGHLFSEGGDADRLSSLQSAAPQELQRKIRDTHLENAGQRKPVTILFADIVGSTSLAEKMDPEEPLSGLVFHYLVRAQAPHVGSWGRDSAGVERTDVCP